MCDACRAMRRRVIASLPTEVQDMVEEEIDDRTDLKHDGEVEELLADIDSYDEQLTEAQSKYGELVDLLDKETLPDLTRKTLTELGEVLDKPAP